jgi:hypothetical protein
LYTEEQMLDQEFEKISGGQQAEFRGKTYPIPQMMPFLEEADRATREEAWRAQAEAKLKDADALDNLFDRMYDLRQQIARNAGFDNYRDYRFKDMRRCREEIEKHAGVRPGFYRPPLGHLDLPTLLARWIERTPLMLWSIDTDDWRLKQDPEAARARADAITAGLEANPDTSEILLFHDWGPNTPMMLNRILPRLAKAGRPLSPSLKS